LFSMFFWQFRFFTKRKLQANEEMDGLMTPFIKLIWCLVLLAGLLNLEQTISSFVFPLVQAIFNDDDEV
jgi:hypothetical protein